MAARPRPVVVAGGITDPEFADCLIREGKVDLVAIGRGPLNRDQRKEMEEAGAELLRYLPVHGYQLRVSAEDRERIEELPFVGGIAELLGVSPEDAIQILVGVGLLVFLLRSRGALFA